MIVVRILVNLFIKYIFDRWSFGGGLNYKSEVYKDEIVGCIM